MKSTQNSYGLLVLLENELKQCNDVSSINSNSQLVNLCSEAESNLVNLNAAISKLLPKHVDSLPTSKFENEDEIKLENTAPPDKPVKSVTPKVRVNLLEYMTFCLLVIILSIFIKNHWIN